MSEKQTDKVYIDLKKVPLQSEIQENKKKKRYIFINISIFVVLISIGIVLGILINKSLHPVNNGDPSNTFGEIEAVLENYYYYKNDYEDFDSELEDKAFYGMTEFEDDPYTSYMSKQEIEDLTSSINMDYVGIGVVYSLQDDYAVIERVIIDSPAEKAGLLAGDIITAVDATSIKGLSTSDIKNAVVGEVGTTVTISITRDNVDMDIDVIRGEVDNSVYCYSDDDYVVMELYSFGESTGKECMSYLNKYTDYSKIIIDLRGDTGGYQTAVAEIAGLFIGNNEVYLKQIDSNGVEKTAYTKCSKTYDNFKKIVILVNESTASAAEVFAICLKEQLDNVTIVGTNTYGKGVIQSTHYLANGGALKFTSYSWLSPNGVSINGVGITPDIEVKLDDIYYSYYASMQDDETYQIDSVGDVIEVCQLALRYLDYDIDRTDGYFDQSLADAIVQYKLANDLGDDATLDKTTYNKIISQTLSDISKGNKDYQMQKAIELISE